MKIRDTVRRIGEGECVGVNFCGQDVWRDGPFWLSSRPMEKGDIVLLHSRRKNGKPKRLIVIATTPR